MSAIFALGYWAGLRVSEVAQLRMDHCQWTKLKRQSTADEYALIHDIRFHDLRHDWVHRARQANWALEEIAVCLGHQTKAGTLAIATTVRYTLPSRQQIKKQLHRLSG